MLRQRPIAPLATDRCPLSYRRADHVHPHRSRLLTRPDAAGATAAGAVGAASGRVPRLVGALRHGGHGCALLCDDEGQTVEPTPDGYTEAYLYLTHRPADNVANEINLVAGFDFAPDQPAVLTVGAASFDLFTQKDSAWLLDPRQFSNLAGAMRAGSTLVVEGTNAGGVKVNETFSLSGATAASRAIDGGC